MAEASDFKFGTLLGFAKAHHKTTPRKSERGLVLGKLPYIWGSPLTFLQRPHCPLRVSGASCFYLIQTNNDINLYKVQQTAVTSSISLTSAQLSDINVSPM